MTVKSAAGIYFNSGNIVGDETKMVKIDRMITCTTIPHPLISKSSSMVPNPCSLSSPPEKSFDHYPWTSPPWNDTGSQLNIFWGKKNITQSEILNHSQDSHFSVSSLSFLLPAGIKEAKTLERWCYPPARKANGDCVLILPEVSRELL